MRTKKLLKAIASIGLIGVVIFIMATLQPFKIKGESMQPTLEDNDYLLIDKLKGKWLGYKVGDIVVFETDTGLSYVKRVIGVEGDKVESINGNVYVNDKIISEPYLYDGEGSTSDFSLREITGKSDVPKGYVWVLGDNRKNSLDSRNFQLGVVPVDTIKGIVTARLLPIKDFTLKVK